MELRELGAEPLTAVEKIALKAGRWCGAAVRRLWQGLAVVSRALLGKPPGALGARGQALGKGLGKALGKVPGALGALGTLGKGLGKLGKTVGKGLGRGLATAANAGKSASQSMAQLKRRKTGSDLRHAGAAANAGGRLAAGLSSGSANSPVSNPGDASDEEFGFDQRAMPGTGHRAFWLGAIIVVLSLVSGLATYFILTGLTPIQPRNDVVIRVLFVNVLLIIAMIVILSWQAFGLARAWRQKIAGARLHVRIVLLFSIIAALPSILLAVSATITFSRSLDNLFSRSTRSIVANSLEVANAYLDEHGQVIRNDIVNMTKDIDDAAVEIGDDPAKLRAQLIAQAGLRELPIAFVIDVRGKILVMGIDDVKVPYVPPRPDVMAQAKAGHVPLLLPSGTYRVAAITRLEKFPGRYLYVARRVNPKVIRQVRRTEAGVAKFNNLRHRRGGMKLAHALMYFMISLTALLAAIWVGMWFAGSFVAPIRRLIGAAQQVSTGNLKIQLPLKRGEGDLRRLSQTFNHMTSELKTQRDALVTANEQLLERRVFMEAMLSGVSAGVIGLDGKYCITLANRSAEILLGRSEGDLKGRQLDEAVPTFGELIGRGHPHKLMARSQAQVRLEIDGIERTFAVRATQEQAGGEDQGWVVTFDDITELVAAQRNSAWADVAQRIAHEIKNPLTPIQLSAERIRRKYGKVIVKDREVFDKCTETIIRQVGDVARMVDEFSSFARMPKAEMAKCDLRDVVRDPVFLFEMGNSHIDFKLDLPDEEVIMACDRRLISQLVTNLVKNASEAIMAASELKDKPDDYRGRIEVSLRAGAGRVMIEVLDNGIGLPKQNRSRLVEPYVTNRAKGTGLGLAIVQKIVEQHDGTLDLQDAPVSKARRRGALVRVTLPMPMAAQNTSAGDMTTTRDAATGVAPAEPAADAPQTEAQALATPRAKLKTAKASIDASPAAVATVGGNIINR